MVDVAPFSINIPMTQDKDSVKPSQDFLQYMTTLVQAINEEGDAGSWTSLTVPPVTGASFDVTGIPTTAQEVQVLWKDIVFDSIDRFELQPLVGGVVDNADITSATRHASTSSTSSILTRGSNTTNAGFGDQAMIKFPGINSWLSSGTSTESNNICLSDTRIGLIGSLDGIRVLSQTGSNFIGGTVAVLYR